MKTKDDNKLIAEFMEFEAFNNSHYYCRFADVNVVLPPQHMKFDSDWNWLMPVVAKCKELWDKFEFDTDERVRIEEDIFNLDYTLSDFMNNQIGQIYARVVEFIHWHKYQDFYYTPENSDDVYHYEDFVRIAKGNYEYARMLMDRVEWQHPETLVEEDLVNEEITEVNGTYVLTNHKK